METRTSGSRGCIWAAAGLGGLIALVVVAIALVAAIALVRGFGPEPEWREEHVSGEGADKIAVLPVTGIIGLGGNAFGGGGAGPEQLRSQLRQSAEDPRVRAVVLEVNSPGGEVVASDEMHQAILEFKEETKKPVIVSMGSVAASGGYYISTAADRIIANRMTMTGSLGVIMQYLHFEEAARKLGVEEVTVRSGKLKDIGSALRDPTRQELEILQELVDESYGEFVEVIVEGRKLPEQKVRRLADGRIYSGQQAKAHGLVDELGDLELAAQTAKSLAKVEGDVTVVRYSRTPSVFELLRARLNPGEPEAVRILKSAGITPYPTLLYLYRP